MTKEPTVRGAARGHILETASELFYRDGIRATGVDTIIAAAGVSKKTFYYHFPSKDELVLAFIGRRDAAWREALPGRVAGRADQPAVRILAIFDLLNERFLATDFRGCAFTNTIIETANREHPAHRAAQSHKDFFRDFVSALLEEAGIADPAPLAYQLMLLIDGALVTALREGTPQAAAMARRAAATLLGAAGLQIAESAQGDSQ